MSRRRLPSVSLRNQPPLLASSCSAASSPLSAPAEINEPGPGSGRGSGRGSVEPGVVFHPDHLSFLHVSNKAVLLFALSSFMCSPEDHLSFPSRPSPWPSQLGCLAQEASLSAHLSFRQAFLAKQNQFQFSTEGERCVTSFHLGTQRPLWGY